MAKLQKFCELERLMVIIMATPVLMPKQGQSVESCIITKWNKNVGDTVAVGDILFSYETDKASFDETATVSGTFLGSFFEEGDDVPCLIAVCVIGDKGEDISAFNPNKTSETKILEVETQPAKKEDNQKALVKTGNAQPVMMPKQGQSVESCIITTWNKNVGDSVAVGDIIFSYETDKASFDEESTISGTLLARFFDEGDDVPCLTNVCVIGNAGDSFEEFNPTSGDTTLEKMETSPTIAPETKIISNSPKSSEDLFISPRAKNLAKKQGADYRFAEGTGPKGRIIEKDVRMLIEKGVMVTKAAEKAYTSGDNLVEGTGIGGRVVLADLNSATTKTDITKNVLDSEYEEVKITNIRKVIAKSMCQSLSTMAQLTLNSSFDATNILTYRSFIKENREKLGLPNITLNDIILFCVSRTILNHRECNAHYLDDKMLFWNNVHLGVAIDTKRGLMVPTIQNANKKSLSEIAVESKELATAAQSGTINPDLLSGGTFTVTNLGTLGVESFTPVINPPQTTILGVNTIETKIKKVDGEYKHYSAMSLSLTFDHRALDGAPAAKFLKDLCFDLENFSLIFAK